MFIQHGASQHHSLLQALRALIHDLGLGFPLALPRRARCRSRGMLCRRLLRRQRRHAQALLRRFLPALRITPLVSNTVLHH